MEYLQNFLPSSYVYKLIDFFEITEHLQGFEANIRANIYSKAEAESWLDDFESLNKVNFRVLRTYAHGELKLVFKKDYRCHHNTGASLKSSKTKNPSSKHVNCPAFLRITVKKCGMKRSQDKLLNTYPCELTIRHIHNHLLESADVLRHRRPTKETEEKILELFAIGHSPSSALDLLKYDLQEEYGSEYNKIAADGALCPKLQWVFHKYHTKFKKAHKASDEFSNSHISSPSSPLPTDRSEEPSDNDNLNQERFISIQQNLQRVFDKLLQDVQEDPHILDATEKFIQNFDNIKTNSALISSLHMFGKQNMEIIDVQLTSEKAKLQHTCTPGKHGYLLVEDADGDSQWLVPLKKIRKEPQSLSVGQNITLKKNQ
ncbi:uncharacterized protein LOC126743717 [Anthonomus grandis grandis]|uniref:uncharacterized protein LOC126743717 n=1 Tax=Anthonomus grandis grandis TaxID=2921223 RepID=UPI002165B3CE|nr:uncharacterized protein LOC126743717 [Anthonomus grandis grandis]